MTDCSGRRRADTYQEAFSSRRAEMFSDLQPSFSNSLVSARINFLNSTISDVTLFLFFFFPPPKNNLLMTHCDLNFPLKKQNKTHFPFPPASLWHWSSLRRRTRCAARLRRTSPGVSRRRVPAPGFDTQTGTWTETWTACVDADLLFYPSLLFPSASIRTPRLRTNVEGALLLGNVLLLTYISANRSH